MTYSERTAVNPDQFTSAALVRALTVSLFVDSWEKLHIIKQECKNLDVSLKSFIKHIDVYNDDIEANLVKHIRKLYKFNQSEKEYLFSLRGIRNLYKLVEGTQQLLVKHFNRIYQNVTSPDSPDLFRFVCLRDALTDMSSIFLAQLRNYQMNLIQIRAHSPTVAPLPDILRRVNLNSYASFIQDYTRVQRHDLVNFLRSEHREDSRQQKKSDEVEAAINKINSSLSHIDIVHVWRHLISSFFYPIISTKKVEDKLESGTFVAIETAYFFLEFPAYMPLLSHEMAHFLVDQFDNGDKVEDKIPFAKLLRELQIEMDAYFRMLGIPDYQDRATDIAKEILVDIIAIYMQGPAYLYALFLQIVGVGGCALYRDYDDRDFRFIEEGRLEPFNIVPQFATGVPWQLRLKVACYVCSKIDTDRSDVSGDNISGKLYAAVRAFVERHEISQGVFYRDFPALNTQTSIFATMQDHLFKTFKKLIDKDIIDRYQKQYLSYRTYISEDTYAAIQRMMRYFTEKHIEACFRGRNINEKCLGDKNREQCKQEMMAKIGQTRPVRVEDVAWQVSFIKAWCINCDDAGGLTRPVHKDRKSGSDVSPMRITRYPSGKKSFILANESYAFKEALYSSSINYPGMIDLGSEDGDNDYNHAIETFRQRIRERKHFWEDYEEITDYKNADNKKLHKGNPWFRKDTHYSYMKAAESGRRSFGDLLQNVVTEYRDSITAFRLKCGAADDYVKMDKYGMLDPLYLASPEVCQFFEDDFENEALDVIQEASGLFWLSSNAGVHETGKRGEITKKTFVAQLNSSVGNIDLLQKLKESGKYAPGDDIEKNYELLRKLYLNCNDLGDTEKLHIAKFNRELMKDYFEKNTPLRLFPSAKKGYQLRLRQIGLRERKPGCLELPKDLEKKIMKLIVPKDGTMNICAISLCRRDFRKADGHIDTASHLKKMITGSAFTSSYGGTLFGPYSFLFIQEDYYQNEEFKLWELHDDNKFEFHAKSKIMFRVNMPENQNGSIGGGSLNALIRLRLKRRGYHFLLLSEMLYEHRKRWPLSAADRIFISTGWEDIVLLLHNKSKDELERIQQRLYKTYFTDKLETLFLRQVFGDLSASASEDTENYRFSSLVKLNQTMRNEDSVYEFNKWVRSTIEKRGRGELFDYYGQFDYEVAWGELSIQDMDKIINEDVEKRPEIFGLFDDFQTIVTKKQSQ